MWQWSLAGPAIRVSSHSARDVLGALLRVIHDGRQPQPGLIVSRIAAHHLSQQALGILAPPSLRGGNPLRQLMRQMLGGRRG
jgi:hypothetical protein